MVIAALYGCGIGAIAAFPADYLWRRRARTLGHVSRTMITVAMLTAIAVGLHFHIYHGVWSFLAVIVGLVIGSFTVHASAARWWAPVGPDRTKP